jgi:Family of unknown function (DUF6406)
MRSAVPDVGIQIDVVEGQVTHHQGIRFAGSRSARPGGAGPATVSIVVWDAKSDEFSVSLEVGNTFKVAGQTWRLDAIHDDGRGWYADLTRIA